MKRHCWGPKVYFPLAHKSEQACLHCSIVKVHRDEVDGGRPLYWTEFWRDVERIECTGTPACEPIEVEAA